MNGLQKIQQGHLRLGFAAYGEDHNEKDDLEMIIEEDSFSSSFDGSNPSSSVSSSSSDSLDDDDASSPVSSQSDEALFNLSELMSHLPIKRGLSKFYQGKSQSFTSLARVTSLEDLAKKVDDHGGYSRRLKACRSYGGELNLSSKQRSSRVIIKSPKSTIAKKSSSSSCFKGKIKNANSFGKPPLSHVQI